MLSSNGWVSSEQKDEDGAESFQAEDGHRESQASDGDIEGQALGLPVDGSHGPCDSGTQDHAAAACVRKGTANIFAWKGETLEEYWWCTDKALVWPDGEGCDQIVDDGGDATLLLHEGKKFEMAYPKDKSLPDLAYAKDKSP